MTKFTRKQIKEDTKKKVKHLVKKSLNAKSIDDYIDTLFASGIINPEDKRYISEFNENKLNYILSRNICAALGKQLEFDNAPIKSIDKKETKAIFQTI